MRGAEEPARPDLDCDVRVAVSQQQCFWPRRITYTYENIDAIAVAVPHDRVADIAAAEGVRGVNKDVTVERPLPFEPTEVQGIGEPQSLRS